jgi:hypothetical protein
MLSFWSLACSWRAMLLLTAAERGWLALESKEGKLTFTKGTGFYYT